MQWRRRRKVSLFVNFSGIYNIFSCEKRKRKKQVKVSSGVDGVIDDISLARQLYLLQHGITLRFLNTKSWSIVVCSGRIQQKESLCTLAPARVSQREKPQRPLRASDNMRNFHCAASHKNPLTYWTSPVNKVNYYIHSSPHTNGCLWVCLTRAKQPLHFSFIRLHTPQCNMVRPTLTTVLHTTIPFWQHPTVSHPSRTMELTRSNDYVHKPPTVILN